MRLIDADELKIPSEELIAKMAIALAPTIDPVKHGRWVIDGNPQRGGVEWMHCSECGYTYAVMWENPHNYCPNCGARMEGEEDE